MAKFTLLLVFILGCSSSFAQTSSVFKTTSPIFVTADPGGTYDEVINSLLSSGLIDENKNWSAAGAHFVSLGDLSDSDGSSLQIMDLFIKLQKQAVESGGMFHVLLAERQIKSLRGEWRHLSEQAISFFANDETIEQRNNAYQQYLQWNQFEDSTERLNQFNKSYPLGLFARMSAFDPKGKYGSWLTNLPFVIKINDQVFVHGGLSKKVENTDIDTLNTQLQSELENFLSSRDYFLHSHTLFFDLPHQDQIAIIQSVEQKPQRQQFLKSVKSLAFSKFGPSWYRGNGMCHSFFEKDILQEQLQAWGATRLWVGHNFLHHDALLSRFSEQLLILDSDLYNNSEQAKNSSRIVKIDTDKRIIYPDEISNSYTFPSNVMDRQFRNPFQMSDKEVEDFLLTAEITNKKYTKEGRTKPFKVTLEKNGQTIHGIFKYKDTKPNAQKGSWSGSKNEADRYQYEVAAYKLDRMLNIGLVPVTVSRRVDGKKGIIQLWINGLISELNMVEDNVRYKGQCDVQEQVNMMDTFDYLIANRDRNRSNVVFSKDDWQIWFIDHSRSFSASTKRNKALRKLSINPTPAFKSALKTLTREQLESLTPWLHSKQIDAIWRRIGRIISGKI